MVEDAVRRCYYAPGCSGVLYVYRCVRQGALWESILFGCLFARSWNHVLLCATGTADVYVSDIKNEDPLGPQQSTHWTNLEHIHSCSELEKLKGKA